VIFFAKDQFDLIGLSFPAERMVSQFVIEMQVLLAPVAGKQFKTNGVGKLSFDGVHERGSDSLILVIWMDDQPTDMTDTIFHLRPNRSDNNSIFYGF